MMATSTLVQQAVTQLRKCLADVPFCTLSAGKKPRGAESQPDWVGQIRCGKRTRGILLQVKQSGQPRFVRESVNAIARWLTQYPGAVGVFAAPYVSPDAASILSQENMGYVDLSGNCRLCFDNVYVRIEGQSNQFAVRRDLRSLYSPKAERVLRILLLEPQRGWKIEELAKAAEVSLGQAANIKKLLMDREWLRRTDEGLRLADPGALFAEWSENYTFRKNKTWDFYSTDPLPQIEAKLVAACSKLKLDYAFAGFSAAARWAPTVRYQRVMAYVPDRIDQVAQLVGLKPVSSGPNVTLFEPYDAGVMAGCKQIEGDCVTSPVQTYLDVRSFRGRGEEAADAIFRKAIQPTW